MSTYIHSDVERIGKFLNDVVSLRVPTFQRSYAWTDEEVKQLWIDITEAMDTDQTEYFLGPMVLKKEDKNHLEIIDGQQRIATIYALLSVIRRIYRENGDNERADLTNHEYFGKKSKATLMIQPKFRMNEINDPIFQKHVIADSSITTIKEEMKKLLKKDSNYLYLQAITILWDLVRERQRQISGKEFHLDTLLAIEDYLKSNISVLLLTVTDEADAYVIFETLNDRGRGLTTMDLLKNHVFGKSGDYIDQVKSIWVNIRDNLADTDPGERFLYHYWSSKYGRTSKPQLFRLMRKTINSPQTAVSFVQNLGEASKIYSALTIAGHPFWNNYDQRTRDNLETLNLLDVQQALPILLAAAQKFDENEFGKLTHILVVMAVRYNLIGELRTGVLANYYVEIPKKIQNGDINKSAKVFREIKSIYPSDEEFLAAFSIKSVKNSEKARYLLSEIENLSNSSTHQVIPDSKNVNLEHILPKNPSQDWVSSIKSLGDHLDEYTYRLGNLALVSSISNKRLGAKSFNAKKEVFAKEVNLKCTNMNADYPTWLKQDIEDRQQKLAEQAIKVWRIDIQ
jgi:hypothetical protein